MEYDKSPQTLEELTNNVTQNDMFASLLKQVPEEQREEVSKFFKEYIKEFYDRVYVPLSKTTQRGS